MGMGLITLSWLAYKKDKTSLLKDIFIGEILISIWFLIDTIGIYVRNLLVEYKIDNIINFISYALVVTVILYIYKVIRTVKLLGLYRNINIHIKVILGFLIAAIILFLFSYKIIVLQSIPYLCIIYLLQSILGIVCIKEKKEIMQDEKREVIQERNIDLECLTNREKEIVDYIILGLSNKEIGEKLFISPNTVKNHVYNIYKKVNIKNKVELINLVNNQD
jgi:Response regulator containing a CheY-like receiver domain and an HTH DNA-binding domain